MRFVITRSCTPFSSVCPVIHFHLPVFYRVLDIEPDSEDEDVILERRRQLRRAIEEKYQALNPAAASPAKSEASADSDLVGIQAAE